MLLSDIAGLLLHVACWFLALDLFSFRTGNIEHLRLLDAPLDELRAGLDSGLFTSVDLVRANIAQVEEVNPLVHAVNEMNPEIVFTAAAYGGDAIGAYSSDREPSGQSLGSVAASSVGLCWVCLKTDFLTDPPHT
ncbi:glutamyl-tRNA(Gln) amidotransferase subunit A [Metarhizium brunneum]